MAQPGETEDAVPAPPPPEAADYTPAPPASGASSVPPSSRTIRALVVDPTARTIEEVHLPTEGGQIVPQALGSLLGVDPDVVDYLDLTDAGERVLVDIRQDGGEQSDWWRYGPDKSFPAPASAEDLVNTAVPRMIFDPGDEAPIRGKAVIARLGPVTGVWGDTTLTREEAQAAVRYGAGG